MFHRYTCTYVKIKKYFIALHCLGRTNVRQRRGERLGRHRVSVADNSGSDDDGPGILEFSTEAATENVDIEEESLDNLDRKNSMQSIAGI